MVIVVLSGISVAVYGTPVELREISAVVSGGLLVTSV